MSETGLGGMIAAATADERRRETRGATVFRPILIETDDFAGFCLVRNLSAHGMRAKVYTAFAPEQRLSVQFASTKVVQGHLVWCDGEHIGVVFDEPIDVSEILADLSKKELDGKLNRSLRLTISALAELMIEGRALSADVRDISQKGIKVLTSFVRPGEELMVRIGGLDSRKAVVRWSHHGMAGLSFVRPLSFDQLAQWVVERQLIGDPSATHDAAGQTWPTLTEQ